MKSKLNMVSTLNMSFMMWLAQRSLPECGGSDAATILGKNPFQPALELFHSKLGFQGKNKDNWATYAGRIQEETIRRDYFPYWDPENPGDEEIFFDNVSKGRRIRKCRSVHQIVRNPEFPMFQINIDGLINKTDYSNSFEGGFPYRKHSGQEGLLECKWLLDYVIRRYESKIPTYYIYQMMTYLGVMEINYGELFIVTDGRYPQCTPFELNTVIFNAIVEATGEFYEKVKEGKALIEELRMENPAVSEHEILQAVQYLEPEPDDSPKYYEYLRDRYNPEKQKGSIDGSVEMLKMSFDYKKKGQDKKEIDRQQQYLKNILTKLMIDRAVDKIDFGGEYGSVSYMCDKGKDKPTFRISDKVLNAQDLFENQ
jgi:hypothetical protein